ncbi:MAG TPA: methylated-DNA--[protein]-cysteine S-methyltransferase [Thermoanaerobaculia bacterium]|jgi:methylated-DNA-[protein]-cysteine S-methyltransferase|nr:methylated-DNA--[protein]-cysteine S-methyltransferase [Thermoanaerobaculia bacterium]
MELRYDIFEDALGFALAVAREGRLIALGHRPNLEESELALKRHWPEAVYDPAAPPLPELRRQLDEYLNGRRRDFEVPLDFAGTEFQRLCWQALLEIPYGQTRSYGQMARIIGRPAAVRAVGHANHDNPIAVIIPCHRVIGANGSLTGYAGGLPIKQLLLELEGALPRRLAGM